MFKNCHTIPAIAAILIVTAASNAWAQPNFGGEWKMNAGRSSFAPLPAPDSMVRKIGHHDSRLKIATVQFGQGREITTELNYTTDGRACKNMIRGQEVSGTARWEGDSLIIESKREVQGMQIGQREAWSLSDDGQTLSIANHVRTPQGEFDIQIVLEKQ